MASSSAVSTLHAWLVALVVVAVAASTKDITRAVAVARDVVTKSPIVTQQATVETMGASVLREVPQLAILSFADEDGNYVMVRRGDAGALHLTLISVGVSMAALLLAELLARRVGRRLSGA